MKIEVTKDWCMKMAEQEGDLEIGAGARPVRNYDQKCYALAEHFLQDEPGLNSEAGRADLAMAIQQSVEDWFFANPKIGR